MTYFNKTRRRIRLGGGGDLVYLFSKTRRRIRVGGGGDLVYSFTYFTDDTGKVSWGQGIILAEKDGNTDERVADDSTHIVKHVHRNCKVFVQM